jgi:hypothetical protein
MLDAIGKDPSLVNPMNPEEIHNVVPRTPFTPFRIHLSNQHTYDITQPELVIVTLRTTHIGIVRNVPQDSDLYDAVDVIANVHIARLEPILPAQTSA